MEWKKPSLLPWQGLSLWKTMDYSYIIVLPGFPHGASGKESACQYRRHKRHRFDPLVRKIPWSRKWQPTPVFLSGKFHRESSLASYSPQVLDGSDKAEHTHTHTALPAFFSPLWKFPCHMDSCLWLTLALGPKVQFSADLDKSHLCWRNIWQSV